MEQLTWLMQHWAELLGSFTAILLALYAFFLIIPGEQPDKAIKWVLDLTQRFSKKP